MNFALVIGINHYNEKPLHGAVDDAREFKKWLIAGGEVPEDNIWLLLSTQDNGLALDNHIDLAITELIDKARAYQNEKNRLYFYFSGHGIGVTYNNTALCLRLWSSKLPNSCISSLDYTDGLINLGLFDEMLIFLDCCREYDYLTRTKTPGFDANLKVGDRAAKLFVAYSTAYGKLSYEIKSKEVVGDSNNKRGAFTKFLLDSLNGDADNDGDHRIYADDLRKHLENNFKSYASRYERNQSSDTAIKGGGSDILICSLKQKEDQHNFILTFKRTTTIEIRDGSDDIWRAEEKVTAGTEWKLNLPKGMSRVIDTITKEYKLLTNFNPNTISHDEF